MSTHWSAPKGAWRGEGIAIVGMAGRFPQARSVEAFWRNLVEGRDCVSRFTREEMVADGVSDALLDGERFVPAGAVVDDIELFDAGFFGISPREAESMDPQQRLFLEVVQHALDDAAIDPARPPGPIGVYAGARLSGYWLRLLRMPQFMSALGWHQVAAGNDKDFLPTQASFRFGLRGPSVNVQSACSTSLLAVSLGCDALIARRCDVAIAGGASISVPQRTGYVYAPSGIASEDGVCRPFDASATGSVLGNGVGAVVLKRAADALTAGDRIYAIIRGVGVNNDGRTKSSFAGPSVKAQAEVIGAAITLAGVAPEQIGYVEAHGTATTIGDPIEVTALGRALGGAGRGASCGIGSLKSNVGHLDPAAGVASLIKAALCLDREIIPPSLHYDTPNPAIDFAAAGVRVIAEPTPWPRAKAPRLAGVSAFGIGGTNVHAVLAEAPLPTPVMDVEQDRPELLTLSAKTETALRTMETELAARLAEPSAPSLASAAFTLALGRGQHKVRRSVVASDRAAAVAQLERTAGGPRLLKDRRVVFLYPGQGRQQLGMGQALYVAEPAYREAFDAVAEVVSPLLGFDARGLVDPDAYADGEARDVTQTALAQPLLFATEVATARLWERWGVRPDDQLGHSIGELAAAHLAGVLGLEDAARVVVERGRLMQAMAPGAMLAVALDETQALEFEDGDVCVAAFNSPGEQTLAGSLEAIERLETRLRDGGVQFTRLGTSHAFHHSSMRDAASGLLEMLRTVRLSAPTRPFVSCVTGAPITDAEAASGSYWAESIVRPVRFSRAARTLLESPASVYVECGAGRALGALVRTHGLGPDDVVLGAMAARGDTRSDLACALDALGQAWQAGVEVDWAGVWQSRPQRRARLPSYPFEPQRHWIDEPAEPTRAAVRPAPATAAENCYVRTWAPSPSPLPAEDAGARNWLVLADPGGFGAEICERLRQGGGRAVAVHAANKAARRSENEFDVDPADPEGMAALVAQLTPDFRPVHVVNAWTAAVPPAPLSAERAELGALLAFHAPLRLLRVLQAAGRPAGALTTLTAGLFAVNPGEAPEPLAAPALGLVRVLPQESGGLPTRLVDLLPPTHALQAQAAVDQVVAELRSAAAEPVVAYRGEMRLSETFQPLPLPNPPLERVVQPGGAYLITGGFGGIGGVLAKTLARVGGARLALVGRRGPDHTGGETARALIRDLEALGATVLPFAADATDPGAMSRVMGEVQARLGRLSGVIHAAGVPGGRLLMRAEGDDAGDVLAPKLRGAVTLLQLVAPHQPDFIMLCSSFASVSGGLGQGEYAAGNAFLDAVSVYGRALGLRTTAISWPAWRDVGMAHAMTLPPELEPMREASLRSGISPDEGAQLFARIVATGAPHVVVAPYPDTARPPAATARAPVQPAPRAAAPPQPVRTVVASPVPEALGDDRSILLGRIGAIWTEVLGVGVIGPEDNFFEIGGQSLMALRIVIRVGEEFGLELNLNEVLETPRLGDFCDLVHARLEEAIAAMPDEAVRAALAEGGPA